jgi:hypothetical protein
MKTALSICLFLFASVIGTTAKDDPKKPNAYRLEILDRRAKPLATAIIWTREFRFEELAEFRAKSNLVIHKNDSKEDDVIAFAERIPKAGRGEVEIEGRKVDSPDRPQDDPYIQIRINFNPGAYDANIDVYFDYTKKGMEKIGGWIWQAAGSPGRGGIVKLTRIFAEQSADGNRPKAEQSPDKH